MQTYLLTVTKYLYSIYMKTRQCNYLKLIYLCSATFHLVRLLRSNTSDVIA